MSFSQSSAAPFREIAADLPFACYAVDEAGWLTYFNEAAVTFWGRRPTIGVDRWCGSLRLFSLDGEHIPHDQCPMAQAIRTGKPVLSAEAMAERPDGVRVGFRPFPQPTFDDNGVLNGGINMLIVLPRLRPPLHAVSSDDDKVSTTLLERRHAASAQSGAVAALFDQTNRSLHRSGGSITPTQWAILRFLARTRRARSPAQVVEWLGASQRSVARDLSSLERRRLIERKDDKLVLGAGGHAALKKDPLHRLADAITQLSDARRAAMAEDLMRIMDLLAAEGGPPPS